MSTVKTQTFADQVGPSVTFSNLSVTETGTGRYFSFLDSPTRTLATSFSAPYDQIEWRSFLGGAAGPGSSINLTFSYDVRSNVPGYGISSLQQSFTQNTAAGAVSLTVSEMVYDQDNNLVGTTSTRLGQVQDPMSTGYAPGGLALGTTYASLRIVVSLTASVADTAVSRALITFSQFEQGFQLSPHLVQAGDASFTTTLYTDADADGVRGANEAGLAGVTVARDEGVEFNLLGLGFGLDVDDRALRWPGFGRLP